MIYILKQSSSLPPAPSHSSNPDKEELDKLRKAKPWCKEVKYFTNVSFTPGATIKVRRAGWSKALDNLCYILRYSKRYCTKCYILMSPPFAFSPLSAPPLLPSPPHPRSSTTVNQE